MKLEFALNRMGRGWVREVTAPGKYVSPPLFECSVDVGKEIVRRYNCHDELVAVLTEALDQTNCDGDLCAYAWNEKALDVLANAKPEA